MSMERRYESANRQDRLTAMIVGYTITPSDTKVAGNWFFIVLISKTTTFTYEIKHMNLLTQTLLLSITSNTIFPIYHTKNIVNYSSLSMIYISFWFWFIHCQAITVTQMNGNNYKILPLANCDILSSYVRDLKTPKNSPCTIMKAK
jgi:hypothetical protein